MAAFKSAYLKSKAIKHIMGVASFTMPAGCYLALFTGDPSAGGAEVTGGSYVRKSLAASLAAEANGSIATNADVNFTSMPASTVTYWAIFDASTSGNMLYYGNLDIPAVLLAGNTFTLKSGNGIFSEA